LPKIPSLLTSRLVWSKMQTAGNKLNKIRNGLVFLKDRVDRWTRVSLVGVDWGSAFLKAVQLDEADGKIVLRRAAIRKLETGKPTDSLIKEVLLEAGITADQVAVGLASPEIIARPFQFPSMPRKELRHAIRLEAEQAILNGHSLSEMALDWHPLTDSSSESIRGLLAVAPRNVVSDRLEQFKKAGLSPRVVDIEGLALWNAYWILIGRNEPRPRTVLLANIGARTTNLVIGRGRDELLLMRDLSIGGQALSSASSAEWVDEIRDSLGYVRSKGEFCELDHIYLTGGASGPQVPALLSSWIKAPVTLWNPLDQLQEADPPGTLPVKKSDGPLLTLAMGLALRRIG